ncbi:MAG TPA: ribokinase [Limnochordia bacterium]
MSMGPASARVLVVGSLNMDLVVRTPRLPAVGETVIGGRLERIPGGKGANQAVAAARLGARVALVGRVGADGFGDDLLAAAAASGVDLSHVVRDRERATGVAAILVEEGSGQNQIVVLPGANEAVAAADVEAAESLVAEAGCVVAQLEVPLVAVETLAGLARRHRVPFVLNPAPACPLPDSLLSLVDVLTPNEAEAERLSGIPVRDAADAERAAAHLRRRGARRVVVTLGARGVLADLGDGPPSHLPAFAVRAVDTVAAGDAFTGGLAVGLAEGMDVRAAVALGMATAAISVTRPGAQPSMPTRAEVEALLRQKERL